MKLAKILLPLLLFPAVSFAADAEVSLVIKDHKFVPEEVRIKANTKVKLIVTNQDATAEEFESHELNREKIVPANSKAVIFVGPLAPGRYPFFGEFHAQTARGQIVAE